jgi:hypothetical protein
MRLGAAFALLMMKRITWVPLPSRAASRSRYSSMSMWIRATPVSMAAWATAGASQSITRGSRGLGMM